MSKQESDELEQLEDTHDPRSDSDVARAYRCTKVYVRHLRDKYRVDHVRLPSGPTSRYTPQQLKAIASDPRTNTEIAREYGCSRRYVAALRARKNDKQKTERVQAADDFLFDKTSRQPSKRRHSRRDPEAIRQATLRTQMLKLTRKFPEFKVKGKDLDNHGFRKAFKTWCDEETEYNSEVAEASIHR